jgi:hypothetical protein
MATAVMDPAVVRPLGASARDQVVGLVRIASGALAILPWISARAVVLGGACSRPSKSVWTHPTLQDNGRPVLRRMMDAPRMGRARHTARLADVTVDFSQRSAMATDIRLEGPSGGTPRPMAWPGGAIACRPALLALRRLRAVPPEADTKH